MKKETWTLEETRVNYSVKELEDHGVKIFKSNTNRLQDTSLISTFKSHLLTGGRYHTPGKLVNARECFKAKRVLYRPYRTHGATNLKVTSVADLTPTELTAFNDGLALVVFDGNHRYNAMLEALKLAKTKKEKDEIKSSVYFNYQDIKASELAPVFLEINTQMSTMDNQDYIPYIIKNWGESGDPIYEFDRALDACQRAHYTGDKKREMLFNYTGSLLICSGGQIPSMYEEAKDLFKIAKRGKDPDVVPIQAQSSDRFKNYILIPYLFERHCGIGETKGRNELVFKNKLSFLRRILDKCPGPGDVTTTVTFVDWLGLNTGDEFWLEYIKARTIRDSYGRVIESSGSKRDQIIEQKFEEFLMSPDVYTNRENRFAEIEGWFSQEVEDLKLREDNLKKSSKSAYTTNHNKLMADAKLSVVAMYKYLYERDY